MCFSGPVHQLMRCLPVVSLSEQLNLNFDVCIFEVVRLVRPSSVSNFTLFFPFPSICRSKCTEKFQTVVIQKEHRLQHFPPDSNIIVMQLKEPQHIWMRKDYLVRACADDSHVFSPVRRRQRSFTCPTHMSRT